MNPAKKCSVWQIEIDHVGWLCESTSSVLCQIDVAITENKNVGQGRIKCTCTCIKIILKAIIEFVENMFIYTYMAHKKLSQHMAYIYIYI